MAERCNCDASCGENRYHDAGDPGCRFADDEEYLAYWDRKRERSTMATKEKGTGMAKVSVKSKLTHVDESFSVNLYDNGYMIEVRGKDKKGDYKTSKIMVGTADELIELVREITTMERAD